MNDDVREIVAQVLYQITSQYATVFELKVGATDETPGMEIDRHAADAILAALAEAGLVVVVADARVLCIDRDGTIRRRNDCWSDEHLMTEGQYRQMIRSMADLDPLFPEPTP